MAGRSQRHLRQEQGYDSAGDTYYPGSDYTPPTPTLPTFTGPIAAQADDVDVLITPLDLGSYFDPDVFTPTYDHNESLPTGLVMDEETGIVTGTPTVVGTYPIIVVCTTSQGHVQSNSFDWVIS